MQLASASRASLDERVHFRVCKLAWAAVFSSGDIVSVWERNVAKRSSVSCSKYQQIAVTSSRNTGKTTGVRNMVTKVLKLLFEHSGKTLHS